MFTRSVPPRATIYARPIKQRDRSNRAIGRPARTTLARADAAISTGDQRLGGRVPDFSRSSELFAVIGACFAFSLADTATVGPSPRVRVENRDAPTTPGVRS
jgi:hypothetical protein